MSRLDGKACDNPHDSSTMQNGTVVPRMAILSYRELGSLKRNTFFPRSESWKWEIKVSAWPLSPERF